jgi:hypothetical protein
VQVGGRGLRQRFAPRAVDHYVDVLTDFNHACGVQTTNAAAGWRGHPKARNYLVKTSKSIPVFNFSFV